MANYRASAGRPTGGRSCSTASSARLIQRRDSNSRFSGWGENGQRDRSEQQLDAMNVDRWAGLEPGKHTGGEESDPPLATKSKFAVCARVPATQLQERTGHSAGQVIREM